MTQLQATQFGFFNPGRLSDEDIERSFIARRGLFEHLFKRIILHTEGDIPQHLLIIGQRGMGKTSLLLRLAVELKKEPHNKLFIPLTFPEEQYNIDRLSKFWLNSLDALADALDREKKTELVKELDEDISTFSGTNDGFELFEKWTNKVGRRAVLLVDNLNLIFDKISTDDQHRLRAILMQEGAPIVVGASSVSIHQTVDYGAPFYDAFQTTYLTKLDLPQSIELLKNLGKLTTGDNSLDSLFNKNHSRIAALHHLTGGTPRTLSMLFPLIRNGFNTEIQYDLEALLDVITPLYKARFEELSSQMQVILDAIALHWDPINLEELRNVTQLGNAQLSPQVKRLADIGWIKKLPSKKSKGGVYEISERFFNVWYLMRRSSRRQIRELYCLTRFLEVFYGPDLDSVAQTRLTMDQLNTDEISWNLAFADATKNETLRNELINQSNKNLIELAKGKEGILNNFNVPKEEVEKEAFRLQELSTECFEAEEWKEVIKLTKQTLNLIPEFKYILLQLGYAHERNGQYLEAIQTLNELISWKQCDLETKIVSFNEVAHIYYDQFENISEATICYMEALKLDAYNVIALENLAQINGESNPLEAEDLLLRLLQITPNNFHAHLRLGLIYNKTKKFIEAEKIFLSALKIDKNSRWAYLGLAVAYLSTEQIDKAESILKEGLKVHASDGTFHFLLGTISEHNSKDISEIKPMYDDALKFGGITIPYQSTMGNFYLNYTNEFEKAEQLLKKSVSAQDEGISATYNLIYLLLDKKNDREKAKKLLTEIPKQDILIDTHALLRAVFAYHEENLGLAKQFILKALKEIENDLPSTTKGDWWRAAATIVKLGHGEHLLSILKESGNRIVLRPYYEAIRAILEKDPKSHFNQIAAELREPTRKILGFMQRYNAN